MVLSGVAFDASTVLPGVEAGCPGRWLGAIREGRILRVRLLLTDCEGTQRLSD